MKKTLDPIILPINSSVAGNVLESYKAGDSIFALRHKLANASFSTIIDSLRGIAIHLIDNGLLNQAISQFKWLDVLFSRCNIRNIADIHTAIKQTLIALYIESGQIDAAMKDAAEALTMLAQNARRKDEDFQILLALILYDLAQIHCAKKEYKQAEREISKAMKLLEKLTKTNPVRYGAALTLALNASTSIYRSRIDQANLLAHYQAATSTYLAEVNSGIKDATIRLVSSLQNEGNTLSQMNRHREAIHFYTRALKYVTDIESDFSLQQLQLSIDLGKALIQTTRNRDKGVHLLNTMLHKATKLNANDQHRQIVDILLNANNNRLDILGFWHKMFPK